MADVTIISIGPRKFHVQIREDDLATSHHVTVPESLINELQLPEEGLDKVVRRLSLFSWSESLPRRSCLYSR
jgi:hypothetical protein